MGYSFICPIENIVIYYSDSSLSSRLFSICSISLSMERSLLFGWGLCCFIPDCCSLTTVWDQATIIVTHICKAIGSRQDRRSKPVILNFLSHCGGHLIYDRNLLNNFCDGERGWAVEISNYPFNSTKTRIRRVAQVICTSLWMGRNLLLI